MLPRFLLRRQAPPALPHDLPEPDPPVCVVGDVHGCADLLERLLAAIAAHRTAVDGTATGRTAPDRTAPDRTAVRLIFAGDLIDGGTGSAAVLARVQALCQTGPGQAFGQAFGQALALMGNHERMMLDFLDAPDTAGLRWLAHGGAETLASFGIAGAFARQAPGQLAALAGALREALPPGQEAWLRSLPLLWHEGDLAVSHAGADPGVPIGAQDPAALLWGHRDFRRRPRTDGVWLVHGHVILPEVRAEAGRIGTDTGAYATGRLSAVWLDTTGMTVIEVRDERP